MLYVCVIWSLASLVKRDRGQCRSCRDPAQADAMAVGLLAAARPGLAALWWPCR
jgi:hypothetical protein